LRVAIWPAVLLLVNNADQEGLNNQRTDRPTTPRALFELAHRAALLWLCVIFRGARGAVPIF
jgi:hypothetical protein